MVSVDAEAKLSHFLIGFLSLYSPRRVCSAPWCLPRPQQDQAPVVHRLKLKDILVPREDIDCLTSCYEGMKPLLQL